MAKISIYLDTRSNARDGKQVIVRINHRGTSAYISTGVYCAPDDFNGDIHEPFKKGIRGRDTMEYQVLSFIRKVEDAIFEIKRTLLLNTSSANDIKVHAFGGTSKVTSFIDYFTKFANERRSPNNVRVYLYAVSVLCDFTEEQKMGRNICFEQVTKGLMKRFKQWLIDSGKSRSTQYNILQAVRAAYNNAVDDRVITEDNKPFHKFEMPKRKQEDIETLSVEQLRKFLSVDLTNQQGRDTLERARDIALISFYLCGANMQDVYLMGKPVGNEAVYTRSKVSFRDPRPIHIGIHPRLAELISRYEGAQHMLLFAEEYPNYSTFKRNLNNRLERISKLLGFTINFAILRRTWATIAEDELDINARVVHFSLGHMEDNIDDEHYVKYSWSKTAAANQRVIDYIWEGVVHNSVAVPKLIRTK